jgi:predicted nucleic acid-binding protein
MKAKERLVVDTNALISRLLLPRSIPGLAVRKAVAEGQLLASDDTIMEVADVLARPKFNPYVQSASARNFCACSTALPKGSQLHMSCGRVVTRRTTSFSSLLSMGLHN